MKKKTEWHASSKKVGMGDFYGTGVKNPVGKLRDMSIGKPKTPSKLGKPPKSLA